MSGFAHDIAGGNGQLIAAQLQSPNFNIANPLASPSPSWAVLRNGLAYFVGLVLTGGTITGPDYIINTSGVFIYSGTPATGNLIGSWAGASGVDNFSNSFPQGFNITMGAISGTTFSGTDFLINSSGAFFYSAAPAAGNMIASIAPVAGTDSHTNTFEQGVNAYQKIGGVIYAIGLNLTGSTAVLPGIAISSVAAAPSSPPGLFAEGSTTAALAYLTSGKETSLDVDSYLLLESQLYSAITGGTAQLNCGTLVMGVNRTLVVGDNSGSVFFEQPLSSPPALNGFGQLYANVNGTVAGETPVGLAGTMPLSQTDNTTFTVNAQTSFSQLSKAWSVPANDAHAGTVYRLTAGGTGTWGSTVEALSFGVSTLGIAPVLNGTFSLAVGATEFTASLGLVWKIIVDVYVAGTGTGTANVAVGMMANVGVVNTANQLTQVGTNQSAGGFASYGSVATGTTTSNSNVTLQARWGAAFGSITCNYSIFERLGP